MENQKKKERMSLETLAYLIERPAIFCMITTKINSYYVVSTIVAIFTTATRVSLKPEYSEDNIFNLMEKLGWVFWLERIGILLFHFYAASGSIFCAFVAWVILLFTNSLALIESPIPSMLVTFFDLTDRNVAESPKLEQGNHNPMEDRKARQEAETASSLQELVPAFSGSTTVYCDSSYSSGGSNEGWEVLDPEEFQDNNLYQIESDNSKAEEEVPSTLDPIYRKPVELNQDDIMSSQENCLLISDCIPIESRQDDIMPPLEDCFLVCDCKLIESNQDNTTPPLENCLPVFNCKSIKSSKDDTMPPLEDCLPVSYYKQIESSQDKPMLLPEDCYPVSEKLKSRIDDLVPTVKRLLIDLILERDKGIAADGKQVKEAIKYLLKQLIDAEKKAEFFKELCNSYNSLDKNTPIEECYGSEFCDREEDDNKKKKRKSNQSDEEHDREEEGKKWQEEWNRLVAEVDTLKASEAELEQNAIVLEHELQFLRRYYQDSMNYYLSYQHQCLPPCSDLNVIHLEYHLRELVDKVEFLNKELEYERRFSNYYRHQCDEYSSDKKYMNQAYQDLKEKYVEERRSKDRLVERVKANWTKQKDLKTENEDLVEVVREI